MDEGRVARQHRIGASPSASSLETKTMRSSSSQEKPWHADARWPLFMLAEIEGNAARLSEYAPAWTHS